MSEERWRQSREYAAASKQKEQYWADLKEKEEKSKKKRNTIINWILGGIVLPIVVWFIIKVLDSHITI